MFLSLTYTKADLGELQPLPLASGSSSIRRLTFKVQESTDEYIFCKIITSDTLLSLMTDCQKKLSGTTNRKICSLQQFAKSAKKL